MQISIERIGEITIQTKIVLNFIPVLIAPVPTSNFSF